MAHYPLDVNVTDVSGNNNHGLIRGWIAFDYDRFGADSKAALFDGTSSYLKIEDSPSLYFEGNQITICCWFLGLDWYMYDHADYRFLPIISREEDTPDVSPGSGDFEIMVMDSVIGFWPYAEFKYDFHLSEWYFVALTATNEVIKLFVNGKFVGQETSDIKFHLSEKPIHIGANLHRGDEYLNGYIDDVRIYNRTLAESEILDLYEERGYIPEIKFTYIPEIGSFEYLKGVCEGTYLERFQLAVFINTVGWYNKPYWDAPETEIEADGSWECDITTGTDDELADKITVFLFKIEYNIPILEGDSEFPQKMFDNAISFIEVTRE